MRRAVLPGQVFTEQDETIAKPRAMLTARACRWAVQQIRREHGSVSGLARQLGLVPQRPFLMRGGDEPTGWIAPAATDRAGLRQQLESLYGRVVALEYGSAAPAEIAFCSGSGNSAVNELRPAGVDTLVTGELREEWFTVAQEQRLNLYLCGHYATEMHGVRALAAELAAKFNLPWEFVASENPL